MASIDWKGKRVFITGGTGFIGTHLTKKLVSLGADVALLVLDEENKIPDGVSMVFRGNIQDASDVERAIGRFQPEYIFHLAAQPLVETALFSVYDTLDTNVRGAINLLQACVAYGRTKLNGIVFVSTDKVYGKFEGRIDETAPLLGTGNPYDTSKVCADYLAQMYANVFALPIVIVRSGNIYGEGDKNWDRLIPGTFKSALNGKAPILRSDGKSTRDYIYVSDIVDGYLLLAQALDNPFLYGKAINFGSPRCYTALEIVHEILTVTGAIYLVPEIRNTAKHEIPHQHLNWEWARELGWQPKVSLVEGLEKCHSWYMTQLSGDKKKKNESRP